MKKTFQSPLMQGLLLLLIVLLSGFLRFRGLDWDDDYHLHPDERFLTLVETDLTSVHSLKEYFDTATSTLNPHNTGHTFYVYGTFPIFLVRYVAEWLDQTGYSQVYLVGRAFSAVFDLGIIVLVYLIARRLFHKSEIGLLSALLYGLATLPIQQSHFFTVDTFTNFFITAAIYVVICIFQADAVFQEREKDILRSKDFWNHILFGAMVGLAAASKISAAVSAVLLPLAIVLRDYNDLKRSPAHRSRAFWKIMAAALSFCIVFRVFQPYAFQGPGFFGILPNPKWLDNLRELSVLSSGDTYYPPSLQWARRPLDFAWQNLLLWGFGLASGIPALLGVLGMGCKILKGDWKPYFIIWIWIILYGGWQSLVWNPTMRYLLFIYPMLAISAAWLVGNVVRFLLTNRKVLKTILAGLLLAAVLVGSTAWAFSFSEIYTRPVTRVAATEWIYKHVEGPINLLVSGVDEDFSQPLSYPHYVDITTEDPLLFHFRTEQSGALQSITIEKIQNHSESYNDQVVLVKLYEQDGDALTLLDSTQIALDSWDEYGQISAQLIPFGAMATLQNGKEYILQIEPTGQATALRLSGFITSNIAVDSETITQTIFECAPALSTIDGYSVQFTPFETGLLEGVEFFRILDWDASHQEQQILVTVSSADDPLAESTQARLVADFSHKQDFRGSSYQVQFDQPLVLTAGKKYTLTLQLMHPGGDIAIYGSKRLNESTWDDGLPLYMFGMDPFNTGNGVYYSDLNLELYYDDNEAKLQCFYTSLEEADYIYITSNRQWGSTTQIPERFPLTITYYRALLGCPLEQDLQDCYRDAQPGMFSGQLGFELIRVFQSEPGIAGYTINTQYAEEAFTVYDHPKVLIFKKTADFSMENVRAILGSVDLSKVINLTPAQASKTPGDLSFSATQEEIQTGGGTWSELFSRDSILNRNQWLGLIFWYMMLLLVGVVVYPTTRLIFKGLKDRGYAFSRLLGLLLLAVIVWILGSLSIAVERWLITLVFFVILAANGWLYWRERHLIHAELKAQKKYILQVELVFLGFFVFFLLIRLGNPDLWHEYKGGEKPMDFAYFNAIIKSTIFPPYDPWYAGGYINYYYFGSLIVGIFTKWLGIVPSVAYNFALISFFAFTGSAAFGIGWNFQSMRKPKTGEKKKQFSPLLTGLIFAGAVLLIGNLGTIQMLMNGFKQVAINNGLSSGGGLFYTIAQWLKGVALVIKGAKFTYYPGDWYWIPSRTIPGEAITEFPYFTFLYGDPHAHLYAYPLTLLALGFFLAIVLKQEKDDQQPAWQWLFQLLGGGLLVGVLSVTNTWDYPVYLLLGILAIIYEHFRRKRVYESVFPQFSQPYKQGISCVISVLFFAASSYLFYLPYHNSYGAGYTSVQAWQGTHTPISSLITHWGIFLFFIISWLVIKTRAWLADTPITFLKKLKPYRIFVCGGILLLLVVIVLLLLQGVSIAIIMVPLSVWVFLLLLDDTLPLRERVILLFELAGSAMLLMVEVIVLSGDVGRMNTVFKFYLQAWTFLGLSATFCFVDLFPRVSLEGLSAWKKVWRGFAIMLLVCGLMYPLVASLDKITDRISGDVPLTLDGMDYMQSSVYWQDGVTMDLEQDYRAIMWMQENIPASPVIVEGHVSLYQWGNRYSIYTGLPAVIGWDWHQRQQKQILPANYVTDRLDDVEDFYNTTDITAALNFLHQYDVQYIVVGQLENIIYGQDGLAKFSEYDGIYWQTVFTYKDTIILKVME
ncbi:MAG: phospholipid carrier-dependent glycosyltransferase [Chloroflexi bacterium]|nr:phospholipid carrier-dependent glycosyltransferase [Chloroflexota bacterium]